MASIFEQQFTGAIGGGSSNSSKGNEIIKGGILGALFGLNLGQSFIWEDMPTKAFWESNVGIGKTGETKLDRFIKSLAEGGVTR